jgi:hypothetical protein
MLRERQKQVLRSLRECLFCQAVRGPRDSVPHCDSLLHPAALTELQG